MSGDRFGEFGAGRSPAPRLLSLLLVFPTLQKPRSDHICCALQFSSSSGDFPSHVDFIELQASVCVTRRGVDRPVPCLGELTFPGGDQQYTCKQIRQPAPWGVASAMIKTKAGKGPVAGDCFHRVPSVWILSGLRLGKDVCHREARPPCCCLQGGGTGCPDLPLRPEAGSRGVPPLQARGPGEAGTWLLRRSAAISPKENYFLFGPKVQLTASAWASPSPRASAHA